MISVLERSFNCAYLLRVHAVLTVLNPCMRMQTQLCLTLHAHADPGGEWRRHPGFLGQR